jgi:hypothetical protein
MQSTLPDTSDVADTVPAMLSEDLETVCLSVEILDTEKLNLIRSYVLGLIDKSPEARAVLSQQPRKLEALGIPLPL